MVPNARKATFLKAQDINEGKPFKNGGTNDFMQIESKNILKFLKEVELLKSVTRHSWTSSGRQESVAATRVPAWRFDWPVRPIHAPGRSRAAAGSAIRRAARRRAAGTAHRPHPPRGAGRAGHTQSSEGLGSIIPKGPLARLRLPHGNGAVAVKTPVGLSGAAHSFIQDDGHSFSPIRASRIARSKARAGLSLSYLISRPRVTSLLSSPPAVQWLIL